MIGLSFNIKYDDTYSERYKNLMEAMKRFNPVEDSTTSFLFLDTDKSASDVDLALYGVLDYSKDKAFTFKIFQSSIERFGPR